jgi:hypothetical protein
MPVEAVNGNKISRVDAAFCLPAHSLTDVARLRPIQPGDHYGPHYLAAVPPTPVMVGEVNFSSNGRGTPEGLREALRHPIKTAAQHPVIEVGNSKYSPKDKLSKEGLHLAEPHTADHDGIPFAQIQTGDSQLLVPAINGVLPTSNDGKDKKLHALAADAEGKNSVRPPETGALLPIIIKRANAHMQAMRVTSHTGMFSPDPIDRDRVIRHIITNTELQTRPSALSREDQGISDVPTYTLYRRLSREAAYPLVSTAEAEAPHLFPVDVAGIQQRHDGRIVRGGNSHLVTLDSIVDLVAGRWTAFDAKKEYEKAQEKIHTAWRDNAPNAIVEHDQEIDADRPKWPFGGKPIEGSAAANVIFKIPNYEHHDDPVLKS